MVRPDAGFLVIYRRIPLCLTSRIVMTIFGSESIYISFLLFRSSPVYVSREADVKGGARGGRYVRETEVLKKGSLKGKLQGLKEDLS
jgi:hypothetical protein